MSKDRIIQLVCLVVAIAGIGASAMLAPPLNRQRRDLQLTYEIEVGDHLPPEYALLPALGSLRGVFVDMLWYRAEMLKREGKFHESNTLAEFITKLQPRFPSVWVFHAWNLSFNISVETFTPEERWDWVRKGISLLRDEGLVYNPTSVLLYKELGWQLFFKLGKDMDDAHWYYKTQWAREWHELLGEPPRGTVEGRTEETGIPVYEATEAFARIAEAAETYFASDRLVDPLTRFVRDHEDVRPLVRALREAGVSFNAAGLRRVGRLIALEPYVGGLQRFQQLVSPDDPQIDHAVLDILADAEQRRRLNTLLLFWRAKALIEDYHMKPVKMLEVMRTYGPLDWRHPASHAAYFGYMGVQMAGELRDNSRIDVLNTARGDIHATQLLTDAGNVVYNPVTNSLDLLPDPRFIPAYDIAWDKAITAVLDQHEEWQRDNPGGPRDNFAAGHENFLLKAMMYAYLYGDSTDAQRYYDKARRLYADQPHNQRTGRYNRPLEDMILSEYALDWSQPKVMLAFIEGRIQQAMLQGLRLGRPDVFNRFIGLARQGYDRFREKYDYSNVVSGESRIALGRSWPQLMAAAYTNVMRNPQIPLIERSRIWFNTPPQLQSAVYDQMRPLLREQCEAANPPIDFARAFPPPPGWSEPTTPAPTPREHVPNIERQ